MWISKLQHKLSIPLFCLLLLSTDASAQHQLVTLDPEQTQILFTLAGAMNTVRGHFKLKSGTIRFDEISGDATGALIVDATTGDSGNRSRDNRMNKDILETDKYPDIVFIPIKIWGSVARSGGSKIDVEGKLCMHGSEKPMTLTVYLSTNGQEVAVKTRFDVPYQQWHVPYPHKFLVRVSKQASINIVGVGSITREEASAAR